MKLMKQMQYYMVTIVSIYLLMSGSTYLMLYILSFIFPINFGLYTADIGIVALNIILSIVAIFSGIFLKEGSNIARILATVYAITRMINFPYGTIIGVFILIVLYVISADIFERKIKRYTLIGLILFVIGFIPFLFFSGVAFSSYEKIFPAQYTNDPYMKLCFDYNETDANNFIVVLTNPSGIQAYEQQNMVIQEIENIGLVIRNRFYYTINAINVIGSKDKILELAGKGYVKEIYENNIIPSDDLYLDETTPEEYETFINESRKILNIKYLWDKGLTGNNVVVAVIDSGINEEIFIDKVIYSAELYYDYLIDPDNNFNHGTAVANCVVGIAPDVKLADIEIFFLQEINDQHYVVSDDASIIWGFERVAEFKQQHQNYFVIASCSFGSLTPDTWSNPCIISESANNLALNYGVPVIASAGNSAPLYKIGPPASAQYVLAVASCNKNLVPSSFSSEGPTMDGKPKPDVTNIGENVVTINWDGTPITVSGTSFSCPLTSGIIACLMEKYNNKKPVEIYYAMKRGCTDIYIKGFDYKTGYGFVNPVKTYQILEGMKYYRLYQYISMLLMFAGVNIIIYSGWYPSRELKRS